MRLNKEDRRIDKEKIKLPSRYIIDRVLKMKSDKLKQEMKGPRMAIFYAGSFDPITKGHIDIIDQALKAFPDDELYIGIAQNPKKTYLFNSLARVAMIRKALDIYGQRDRVAVAAYTGLTLDCANELNARLLIRGLRAVSDFDGEVQMTLFNRNNISTKTNRTINTVFFIPHETRVYLSSSAVREIASVGGNVDKFVTPNVADALREKFLRS